MTGCPKSDKGGGQLPHSLFFNYPINCSSSLELPSFSKEVMLRSVRKAFWEDWLGFLRLFQSIQGELACVNEALNAVQKQASARLSNFGPGLSMHFSCSGQDTESQRELGKKKRRWSFLLLRGKTSPKNSIWYVNHSSHSAVYCVAIFHSLKFLQQPYGTDSVYY